MSRLRTVENLVRPILESNIEARNSDDILIYLVVKTCLENRKIKGKYSFENIILNRRKYGIPSFETIRRVRQKIQENEPRLGCSPEVRRKRNKQQNKFIEYALEKEQRDEQRKDCKLWGLGKDINRQ